VASLTTAALLAVALGMAAASCARRHARACPRAADGPVDVYGFVELVEPRPTRGQRLTIRVTALEKHEAHAWPYRVRVRTMAETRALEPGDAVGSGPR
jgi:competence protein ComEC